MRRYYPGITIFKLVGSIMVVAAHVMLLRYTQYVADQQLQFLFLILRVVVPCFYVVAGFLAYHGWSHAQDSRRYVRRYIIRLSILYGIFCAVFVVDYIVPELVNHGFTLTNLIMQAKIVFMAVFLNGPYVQFWFIPPLLFSIWAVHLLSATGRLKLAVAIGSAAFVLCQFLAGTLLSIMSPIAGDIALQDHTYMNYAILFVTRYFGFGFTFVLVGVLLAKYEAKFLTIRIRRLLVPALILTVAEGLLLYQYVEWDFDYKLAFSLLPNTILIFYGVLRIRGHAIRTYHRIINLFSIVAFCGHVLFMKLNLFVLGWGDIDLTLGQDLIYLAITLCECIAATFLLSYRKNNRKLYAANTSI